MKLTASVHGDSGDSVGPAAPKPSPRTVLALRSYLATRLGPLAVLLLAVVSISAPVAYLVVATDTVRERADTTAEQLARALREDMLERPAMWRYDVSKIDAHLDVQGARHEIRRIELVDTRGARLGPGRSSPEDVEDLLWTSAEIVTDDGVQAFVWVGASLDPVESMARLLLLAFLGLGGLLAGLMYWLPLRAISVAEKKITELVERLETSQGELAALNMNLEGQVVRRSSELEQALDDLREKERRLRQLSRRAVALQEAERRALSRDLHDSVGQTMTAIRIQAQLVAAESHVGSSIRTLAEKNIELIDLTLEEIRRVVNRLAPAVLDDLGLWGAVEGLCQDFADRHDIEIDLSTEGLEVASGTERFPGLRVSVGSGVEKASYRLVQESLTNVVRHARASHVFVRLSCCDDRLRIVIKDDGVGFDLTEAKARHRRGLEGMSERVELLGGMIDIGSRPGKGTRIEVELPIAPDPQTSE